jgi:hypothetical protein
LEALDPDKKVLQLKYSSPQIGEMDERQISLWSKSLLLKIHVITGWVIPDTELLNILVDQFQKKLMESYSNLNVEEIEYAFRKEGTTKPDWGKQMNLALIDEVLIPYLNHRFNLSMTEEERKAAIPKTKIYTQEENEDLIRGDIEAFYQRCLAGRVPYALPEYFKPMLLQDGLMKEGETLVEFFQYRLNNGVKNIYQKKEAPMT